MNWVIIVAGLLPLWAAIIITITNMRQLNVEDIPYEPERNVEKTPFELELSEQPETVQVEPSSLFGKIKQRFKRKQPEQVALSDELDFSEELSIKNAPVEASVSIGLPSGITKLWGLTLVLVFFALFIIGSQRTLEYAFKEYRWIIGTTNPWTNQLETASSISIALAGFIAMVTSLKTGIYLLRK